MMAMFDHGCHKMVKEASLYQSRPTALHLRQVLYSQPANVPQPERSRVIKGPCFANSVSAKFWYFGSVRMTPFIYQA